MRLLDGAFLAMIAILAYAVVFLARRVQRCNARWDRFSSLGAARTGSGLFASDQSDWRQNAARGQQPGPNTMNSAALQAKVNPATAVNRAGPPSPRRPSPPDEPVSPAGGF